MPTKQSLQIPSELLALIESGFWPRDNKSSMRQNLKPLVPKEIVKLFAPEEDNICFHPPPFRTVATSISNGGKFWLLQMAATNEIDPELTMLIGDFGLGSDAPIALDYRGDLSHPRVIRLKWGEVIDPRNAEVPLLRKHNNHWVEIAPTFAAFAKMLEGNFKKH